jgi:predicted phosphodiesterase
MLLSAYHSGDMRVAALCDIRGNLPALNAVLKEVDSLGVDGIVVGGDVASAPMLSMPAETLDALRARGALFVRGNADRVLDFRGANDGEIGSVPGGGWHPDLAKSGSRSLPLSRSI